MPRYLNIITIAALATQSLANPFGSQINDASGWSHTIEIRNPPSALPVSHIAHAEFSKAGRSGVPVMHAALLTEGKVVFLDKIEDYTELRLNNGRYAYSSIYDPETFELLPLTVRSNAFCSGGAFLDDGRLLNVGGNFDLQWLDPTVGDGLDAIRFLDAKEINNGWTENEHKLSSKR